jgi:hypothetical protein
LQKDLTHYLQKARYPYLDTYKDKPLSDLVLDRCRALEELKNLVLAEIEAG